MPKRLTASKYMRSPSVNQPAYICTSKQHTSCYIAYTLCGDTNQQPAIFQKDLTLQECRDTYAALPPSRGYMDWADPSVPTQQSDTFDTCAPNSLVQLTLVAFGPPLHGRFNCQLKPSFSAITATVQIEYVPDPTVNPNAPATVSLLGIVYTNSDPAAWTAEVKISAASGTFRWTNKTIFVAYNDTTPIPATYLARFPFIGP